MAATATHHKTSSVLGTGANLDVIGDKCGFQPSRVRILNVTDGSVHEWRDTMPDGYVFEDKGGTMTYRTSGGITPLAAGFRIGTQANLNGAGDELHIEAWG